MSDAWCSDFITAEKDAELRNFFAVLKISDENYREFYYIAALLASHENGSRDDPTNKTRIGYLEDAFNLSEDLSKAIDKIYFEDRIEVGPLRGIFHEKFNLLSVLDDFRSDLNNRIEVLKNKGVNGRRKTLEERVLFISFLWDLAEPLGLVLGRNNDFHRLCDAVFQAAGVHAKAEGALRYFIENGAPPLEDE